MKKWPKKTKKGKSEKSEKKTDKIDTEKVTKLEDLKGWTPLKIVPEKLSGTSEVYGEQGSTPSKICPI